MSAVTYQELITKSFRDNAIRSVMLIDDDFLPYDKLVELNGDLSSTPDTVRRGSQLSSKIHKFFQQKKIVCDVDQGTEHLDIEKIRKCDLIILDYHLEHLDPSRSLSVISGLSQSQHMNLVVVYTADSDLGKVWREIAVSLVGAFSPDRTEEFFSTDNEALIQWNEKTEDGSIDLPENISSNVSESALDQYLLAGKPSEELTNTLQLRGDFFSNKFIAAICNERLNKLNHLRTEFKKLNLSGKNSADTRWLQLNNVFVIIKQKPVDIADFNPIEIWDAIELALIDWDPTYYQLLISEVQNQLENTALSFSKDYLYDSEGQAGWLHQLLAPTASHDKRIEINKLVRNLGDEVGKKLLENNDLSQYAFNLINYLNENKTDPLAIFCANKAKVGNILDQAEVKNAIGHAVNHCLCSLPSDFGYITNGTVISIIRDNIENIYLCTTPACETVPAQITGEMARDLKPHRLMKFIKLESTRLAKALTDALKSNYIFLKKGEFRVAYKAVDSNNQPTIKYMLVKNHDSQIQDNSSDRNEFTILTMVSRENSTEPSFDSMSATIVGQLREHYAARFQAIASSHMGRIGVDFIKF
ncbi:response regulator receiver domain [Undibacterium sp. SXout11W]|uniref:response regulator receiver domain n=1 Tax=Undibacterium sp. SXout11W TaxID=3413050 RepID=UPI003BF025C9